MSDEPEDIDTPRSRTERLPKFACDCGEPLENFELVDEDTGTTRCPNCGETYTADPARPRVICPHCKKAQPTQPPHSGEIQRGSICRHCGDWFEVDLDELRERVA